MKLKSWLALLLGGTDAVACERASKLQWAMTIRWEVARAARCGRSHCVMLPNPWSDLFVMRLRCGYRGSVSIRPDHYSPLAVGVRFAHRARGNGR